MAGAFNMFATGIGNTDAGFIMGTGKLLIKVPQTMRFYLEGTLPKGVMAKDVVLHVIGDIGSDGATYRAMQYEGPGVHALTMDDRMTIANMAIEAGGKNGVFPADEKTFAYVDERTKRNGTKSDYTPVEVDKDQSFVYDDVVDLSKLEPTVASIPIRAIARWPRNSATSSSTAPTSARAPAARPPTSSPSPKCSRAAA
jgi:3-isopropylmalate/(R)-2-methylmalate dehydratase large subunit